MRLLEATNTAEVRAALATEKHIDHVVIGAGLDLDTRLEMIREVFTASDHTTVHLKDRASGPAGLLPFAADIITGVHKTA